MRQQPAPTHRQRRAWYTDAVTAFACFTLCLVLGKGVARLFGPIGGLFFLLVVGGAGWYLARSAWRGLLGDRGRGR